MYSNCTCTYVHNCMYTKAVNSCLQSESSSFHNAYPSMHLRHNIILGLLSYFHVTYLAVSLNVCVCFLHYHAASPVPGADHFVDDDLPTIPEEVVPDELPSEVHTCTCTHVHMRVDLSPKYHRNFTMRKFPISKPTLVAWRNRSQFFWIIWQPLQYQ